jgi:23S rRNA (pseudouridine1915-N3)-methyltransferase
MKVEFWMVGKTNASYLTTGIEEYAKRLGRYLPFQMVVLPDPKGLKNASPERFKTVEGELILSKLKKEDFLVLLDENGKSYTSEAFAAFVDHKLQLSYRRLIFQVGGAYGFSDEVYERANGKLSLSKMTFSHQMVRLFFLEQLYRAMTILRNEPYHNS